MIWHAINAICSNLFSRAACGVELDETFIVTGGLDSSAPSKTLKTVTKEILHLMCSWGFDV